MQIQAGPYCAIHSQD